MNIKQIGWAVGILIVLAIIFGVWSSLTPKIPQTVQQTATKSPVLGGVATSSGNYEYAESTPGYDINALYPQTVPLATADASAKAALTLEQKVADSIKAFKDDATQMLSAEELARIAASGQKYAYVMTYTAYTSPNYVSYVYQVYQDTGGAHPNGFYLTYMFDADGNVVALGDLFKPGARYLDKLSALAYTKVAAELKTRVGATPSADELDTVRIGTAPSPEALQFWYLADGNLHLLFPPYQVAAYALGSFDIAIPLSDLKDLLK